MKKQLLIPVFVFVSILTMNSVADALEFTLDIKNESGSPATVRVYAKNSTDAATEYATRDIQNNAASPAVTFLGLTGICPSYLTGTVGTQPIQQMSCRGIESTSTTERCCANLKFRVIKKTSDKTYHFQMY